MSHNISRKELENYILKEIESASIEVEAVPVTLHTLNGDVSIENNYVEISISLRANINNINGNK